MIFKSLLPQAYSCMPYQVESALQIIREKDSSSSVVIPEVSDHKKK